MTKCPTSVNFFKSSIFTVNEKFKQLFKLDKSSKYSINLAKLDFSKKIDLNFFQDTLKEIDFNKEINIHKINRDGLDSKIKNPIFYAEFDISNVKNIIHEGIFLNMEFIKYKNISEFPSTYRDISFSVKDSSKITELEKIFNNINHDSVKDFFVFDYYINKKMSVIKIGYRIIFQSYEKTLTDAEVDNFMETIISNSLKIQSVEIPGLIR